MSKKFSVVLIVTVLVIFAVAAGVQAGSGWDWRLGSVYADGTIWGLGNHDIQVDMTVTGYVTAFCQNNGGKQAPGRNPIYVEVTGSGTWATDENGKAEGTVFAADPTLDDLPVSPNPKDAGCPSNSWTVVGLDTDRVDWVSANIVITDLVDGTRNDNIDFTCTTTHDADGYAVDLDCTELP